MSMADSLRTGDYFQALENEHRRWLSAFDTRYLRMWENLLNNDEEAALAEARVRQLLEGYQIGVEPNEDLDTGTGGPDFRCRVRHHRFYVEVTCISIAAVDKTREGQWFRPLTAEIWAKCRGKASQCADLDAPALLVIGTFHDDGARSNLWRVWFNQIPTGEMHGTWDVDPQTGQTGDTYESTELCSAAFLRPDETEGIGYARNSVSGLLFCGLRLKNPPRGVLHPNPVRPFDPAILPQVEFGQVVIDRVSQELRVE
jgi:hypothetical protein